ncbi:DNA-binding NarL/FixJ family response regulator [Flavobacterium tiangeerense]|uniref:DNA-binding NarL/FixJ family response regulator n=1 Tax=Flavobacterium tiangeerense TaxID=459471 RepID=A0ABY3FMA4_9FLAO|nr:response regulator [Flavobacterium tiangeerense]TWI01395.1 DNA-binding NarL/FixJ family response regulator [Flavobacterium tiangeerense]
MTIEAPAKIKFNNNILIVDDHPFIIEGYKNAITRYKTDEYTFMIDQAKNCETAYDIITNPETAPFDIAFLDISMPPFESKNIFSGEDLAKLLQRYMPNCKIILLTMYTELLKIKTIVKTINPAGLIVKNDLNFEVLIFAIDTIINNKKYYSDSIVRMLELVDADAVEIDVFDKQILFHLSKGTKKSELTHYILLSAGAIERRKKDLMLLLKIESGLDKDLVQEAKAKGLLY